MNSRRRSGVAANFIDGCYWVGIKYIPYVSRHTLKEQLLREHLEGHSD